MKKEKKNECLVLRKKVATLIEDLTSLESYILDLFTFSPLPICFISPIGVILEFNPAFEKISGYKFYEIIGEGIKKIFDEKEINKLIQEAMTKKEIWAKEMVLFAKEKREIPVSVFTKARKDEKGKIVGLFIGVFDLTEIKKTERELEEKVEDLEKFRKIAVGRELKMMELKEEIERLRAEIKGEASQEY